MYAGLPDLYNEGNPNGHPGGAMIKNVSPGSRMLTAVMLSVLAFGNAKTAVPQAASKFHLQEATIEGIQQAIRSGQVTTVRLVELYLKRIKAYNATCVTEP